MCPVHPLVFIHTVNPVFVIIGFRVEAEKTHYRYRSLKMKALFSEHSGRQADQDLASAGDCTFLLDRSTKHVWGKRTVPSDASTGKAEGVQTQCNSELRAVGVGPTPCLTDSAFSGTVSLTSL